MNLPIFTFEQINEVHDKFGNADTLVQYAQALKKIGVVYYDSFVADGHSEFFGRKKYIVKSPPYHEMFVVAKTYNQESFDKCMKLLKQQKIGYVKMSEEFAKCGIEKWTMDMDKLTFTYFDTSNNKVLVEKLH